MNAILLDTGPLGRIAHPRATKEARDWIQSLFDAKIAIGISDIVDYELRRELIRRQSFRAIERLDLLRDQSFIIPLTYEVMAHAAELWADARQGGAPTAADDSLDADVILAAQAQLLLNYGFHVTVATMNTRHLARFVPAEFWLDIKP
jgi:predicted nucleic acid-binding protein